MPKDGPTVVDSSYEDGFYAAMREFEDEPEPDNDEGRPSPDRGRAPWWSWLVLAAIAGGVVLGCVWILKPPQDEHDDSPDQQIQQDTDVDVTMTEDPTAEDVTEEATETAPPELAETVAPATNTEQQPATTVSEQPTQREPEPDPVEPRTTSPPATQKPTTKPDPKPSPSSDETLAPAEVASEESDPPDERPTPVRELLCDVTSLLGLCESG